MLLLETNHITKSFGDRCVFSIDGLNVYAGDRIGMVGPNGAGKTTLLNIMAGKESPDSGWVKRYCQASYIAQLDDESATEPDGALAKRFAVSESFRPSMSGGEKTRYKIAAAFSQECPLLLADEPTANLHMHGAQLLQEKLCGFGGAVVLVSHDRELLNAVCRIIWQVEDGAVRVYPGNYNDYIAAKAAERARQEHEYEKYIREKRDLAAAIDDRRGRANTMRKTPSRMGNSEARLHKMGNQKAKANLYRSVKAMETRLEKLEVMEKPKQMAGMLLSLEASSTIISKTVIEAKDISKQFGQRILFDKASFRVNSGQRVALLGDNGCGKTTLLKMILAGEAGIRLAPSVRIGYFSQEMETLDPAMTVLANTLTDSVPGEVTVRNLLARLLFRRDDVYKLAGVLSGGEQVRLSLAKLIASDFNVLLMDEPTNYLDLPSLNAVEETLADYPGTLLFVSHDRAFINRVATHLLLLEDGRITQFAGNYEQYEASRLQQIREAGQEERMVLENRLAEVISRLSIAVKAEEKVRLDAEYQALVKRLRG